MGGCATGLLISDPGAACAPDVRCRCHLGDRLLCGLRGVLRAATGTWLYRGQPGGCTALPLAAWRTSTGCDAARRVDPWILQSLVCRRASQRCSCRTAERPQSQGHHTAPYFLGTKIEAFRGRGHADYFGSHDLEDFITVIDGRPSLLQEVREFAPELRRFLADAVRGLLSVSRFLDALPGHLSSDTASQARIVSLSAKLEALSNID